MGFMTINDKANYYSSSNGKNGKQGWSEEINNELVKLMSPILTPEIAEEIKINRQPKETFPNVIDNYDEIGKETENILNPIIMTKQESYGRSM